LNCSSMAASLPSKVRLMISPACAGHLPPRIPLALLPVVGLCTDPNRSDNRN
jgi:hypothetical protein